jgi:hypothetical protein
MSTMTVRTRESTVTFRHPFTLAAIDGPLPEGTYRLVMDEEEILGLSFVAFRRTETLLHLPAVSGDASGIEQCVSISQSDLDAALNKDRQTA